MTTPRTRLPRGRPHIPLKDHPFKVVMISIDLLEVHGMRRQKATLLMAAVWFAKDRQPITVADLPKKLRQVFEQHGGFGMNYTMPSSGNPKASSVKERQQAIDTLNKMDKRYSKGADLRYRKALSNLVYLSMFASGGEDDRRKMVNQLLRQLDDPDPEIAELAGLVLK